MKTTMRVLALLMLLIVTSWQHTIPVHAAKPTFDITGVWVSSFNDTIQIFQENDEVNAILVNSGFAHRYAGRYVGTQTLKMILIRRTRPPQPLCEMTMELTITVNSGSSFSAVAVGSETACGVTLGQSFSNSWKRIL